MFSAGRPSRLPDCGGRDAEPPGNKLPLLISFSQGDLDTVRTEDRPLSYQQASSGRGPAGGPRQASGGHTQWSAEERGAGLRRPPVTGPQWGWGSAVEAQGSVRAWAEGTSTRERWWGNAGAGSPAAHKAVCWGLQRWGCSTAAKGPQAAACVAGWPAATWRPRALG